MKPIWHSYIVFSLVTVLIKLPLRLLKQHQEIRHAMIAFFASKSAGQISLCLKNQTTAYEQNPRRIEGAIKLTCTTKRTPLSLITWLLNKLGVGRHKAGSGAAKQWRAQLGHTRACLCPVSPLPGTLHPICIHDC